MKIVVEVKNPKAIKNVKEFKRQIEESLLLFDDVKVLMPPYLRTLSKEEAIEFAKKYLLTRRKHNTNLDTNVANELSNLEVNKIIESIERAWDIATEFILLDIIPYLYGEALD